MASRKNLFVRHIRFYASALLGVVVWLATPGLERALRLVLAGDVFFAAHLTAMGLMMARARGAMFMDRARLDDDGIVLITLITLAVVGLSLGAIFALLNSPERPGAFRLLVSIASVPLGWLTLHTVGAFHYAHAYYSKRRPGGLAFPGTPEPGAVDFLYYSFTVGMTAQVSDVSVETSPLRALTVAHGIVSFFVNTVLVALAVNIIVLVAKG
ncbi:DUF1345 domain-containing protein [Caulobacter sp. 17J80-11]|uniref:DUF1345 domain-containing protein n=1 Tax=Caulobacter sp. 17J80-11 TaxID=2763502 RepID=UPI0016539209|nr:DUF1345 domain-containing protein [Caulobacter sp. 17J80-11]MBC6982190.1 DUF1345 domain-containing protein [Caulobacter sp. 17J80-11]